MLASYFVFMLIYLNEIQGFNIKIISLSRNEAKLRNRFGVYADRPYFTNIAANINKQLVIDGGIDYFVHAASLASPQYYETIPLEVTLPNVLGTYNILELAKEKHSGAVLFFSTGSVYGKTNKPFLNETDFGTIDPLNIHSCYDESKRIGETLCKVYSHQFGVPTKVIRFSHTYGPTLDIENDPRVFAEFVKNAVHGDNIEMKSDGSAKRAFCYIADATAAEFKVLFDGKNAEAYNICNTEELYAIRDLADIISRIGGVKIIRVERTGSYLEAPAAGIGDNAKLKTLGWECRYDVQSGFARTIASFKLQSNGVRLCR
jgi:nucleoside-diphosphate-sugar epimerase